MSIGFSNLQIWTQLFDGLVLVVHSGCNVKLIWYQFWCTKCAFRLKSPQWYWGHCYKAMFDAYKSHWAGRYLYHATFWFTIVIDRAFFKFLMCAFVKGMTFRYILCIVLANQRCNLIWMETNNVQLLYIVELLCQCWIVMFYYCSFTALVQRLVIFDIVYVFYEWNTSNG
jgi:hypothetical protein